MNYLEAQSEDVWCSFRCTEMDEKRSQMSKVTVRVTPSINECPHMVTAILISYAA